MKVDVVEEVCEGREFQLATEKAGELVGGVGLPETAYRTTLEAWTDGRRAISTCLAMLSGCIKT